MPNDRNPAFRIATGVAALLAAILFAAGCGFSTDGADGGSDEPATEGITLYSGRIAAAIGGAIDAYEADSDTDVQVRFADTGDLAATLVEEGDNSPADVFFAQEPGAIGAVEGAGPAGEAAARTSSTRCRRSTATRTGAGSGSPAGRARSPTGRASTSPSFPTRRSSSPSPAWKGRVGWSPASDSLQQYVTAVRLTYGDDVAREFLEGMVANDAVAFPDNVTIRDAVANGEVDVGLINHYYIAQAIAAEGPDYPVKAYFPPKGLGSLLLLTSAGVLESSERKEEAFDFIRSLLSADGQHFFTSTSKEYPLAEGARPDPSITVPLDEIPVPDVDLNDIGEIQETVELMQETGAL